MLTLNRISKSFNYVKYFKRSLTISTARLNVEENVNKTEKETHFGFEKVKESEKSKKG